MENSTATNLQKINDQLKELLSVGDAINRGIKTLIQNSNCWLTEKEAAEYLSVSPKTMARIRKSGELDYSLVANKHLYHLGVLNRFLHEHSQNEKNKQSEAQFSIPTLEFPMYKSKQIDSKI